MAEPIIRATFGRLVLNPLSRITIGHITINGDDVITITDRRKSRSGGVGRGKNKNLGVKFIPTTDKFKKQRIQEDKDILDLVLVMVEGGVI